MSIENTLAERGARYGEFMHHATIAQELQDAMRRASGWSDLAPDQKQALSVIADKIARMLNGDPDYLDNWHDIIGYAKLVEDRLTKANAAKRAVPANDNDVAVVISPMPVMSTDQLRTVMNAAKAELMARGGTDG